MFYKPKYCCHCGERVERPDRKIWSSRRFCELCETDFKPQEWLPRLIVLGGLLVGVFGLGSYVRQTGEKPLDLKSGRTVPTGEAPKTSPARKTQAEPGPGVQTLPEDANQRAGSDAPPAVRDKFAAPAPPRPVAVRKAEKTATGSDAAGEATYFCGAMTKKGTLCTHRVKGGGRCWQHAGQPAALPPEKLLAPR